MAQELSPGDVNHLVIQVTRQHFTRLHTLMEEIGLYRGQPPMLHMLWKGEGCTQSDLAAHLHVQPATITKMLQRMEHAGFIERRPDPEDQRVSRVYLTAAGRNIEDAVRQRERQAGEELLMGFSPEEQQVLVQFLTRLRDNLLKVNTDAVKCER